MSSLSWTDKYALETIRKLRDKFDVNFFIETGTWKGVNAAVHSGHFNYVMTCENNTDVGKTSQKKLDKYGIKVNIMNSVEFLSTIVSSFALFSQLTPIFYLDAHFYNTNLSKDKRFVVLDELKALKGFENCIIIIHDFACEGLGHITYDGIDLDWNLIGDALLEVNPNFKLYTNTPEFTDILTEENVHEVVPEEFLEDAKDNLRYAWSFPRLTKRGILYAVPRELDLTEYKLKRQKQWEKQS